MVVILDIIYWNRWIRFTILNKPNIVRKSRHRHEQSRMYHRVQVGILS
jgi:hypothetical protein